MMHSILAFLNLAYLAQFDDLQFHPFSWKWPNFILHYDWMTSCFICISIYHIFLNQSLTVGCPGWLHSLAIVNGDAISERVQGARDFREPLREWAEGSLMAEGLKHFLDMVISSSRQGVPLLLSSKWEMQIWARKKKKANTLRYSVDKPSFPCMTQRFYAKKCHVDEALLVVLEQGLPMLWEALWPLGTQMKEKRKFPFVCFVFMCTVWHGLLLHLKALCENLIVDLLRK
jgi:hypothetical protein